jgi:hypothetical protein
MQSESLVISDYKRQSQLHLQGLSKDDCQKILARHHVTSDPALKMLLVAAKTLQSL